MVSSPVGSPSDFDLAMASLRSLKYRPEITVDEAPAPQRLAPHAVALTAEILDPADLDAEPLATGRLVLLHDPDGVESWAGTFRVVGYVRAGLEHDLATDPLLASVGWSWLEEALGAAEANVHQLGGTVTKVTSEGFGSLADPVTGISGQIEIRSSWTPSDPPEVLARHAQAWAHLLAAAAGLLPETTGVSSIGRPGNTRPGAVPSLR